MIRKALTIALIAAASHSYAQSDDIKKANDFLFEYQAKKSSTDIENALSKVKTAMAVEANSNDAFSNYISGLVVKTHFDANGQKNTDQISEAYRYLKKAIDLGKLNDKDKTQAFTFVKHLGYDMYNAGINHYNAKSYDKAYNTYKELIDLHGYLAKQGQKLEVSGVKELTMTDINNNYVIFAESAGKNEESLNLLKQEIASNPSEQKYAILVQKLASNPSEQQKYINDGLAKYPNNKDLLIADINKSMSEKNLSNAKAKLQKLVELDGKNSQYYLLLGNIAESEKDLDGAKKMYQKGLEISPNDYELNYNNAVCLYNEAVMVYNKNTTNEKGADLYLPIFKLAKASFEKCKQIQPSNSDLDKMIKKIDEIK